MSVIYQALCTFIVCWVRMGLSITFAWPAFTAPLFASAATPLRRRMTPLEQALFGSVSSVGALLFTPVLGLLLDVLGRRNCMILAAFTHVLAWVLVVVAASVELVLAGMFVAGAAVGAFVVIPVYITEVCEPGVRGAMSAGMPLSFGVGTLVSYAFGGYLEYTPMCYACLSVVVLGAVMTLTLKESPVFLMKKGREEEAKQAIAHYRNTNTSAKVVMQEMDDIRKMLGGTEAVPLKEEDERAEKPVESVSCWQFFKSSRSTRRATVVALVLLTSSQFQGYVAVCVYAGDLFKEAVPSLSPELCSVLMAGVSIVAGVLSAYLMDVLGRRPLMLYSSLGSGLCCVLLGSQIQLQWGPPLVTPVVIFLFCFIFTLGANGVPFVVAAEVFLPEVFSIMSMVCNEWTWVCTFIILFAFSPLVALLGLGGLFYIFAVICFATAGYVVYFLPETKGLPIDAIQKLF